MGVAFLDVAHQPHHAALHHAAVHRRGPRREALHRLPRVVQLGAAEQFPFPPNTLHKALFARLEREAMQAGRGQWGRAEGGPPWGPVSPAG